MGQKQWWCVLAACALRSARSHGSTQAIKFVRRESRQGKMNKRYELLRQKNFPRSDNHTSVGDAIHSEENRIRKEIAVMKKLYHPHIVQLYEVLDDRLIQTIYLGAFQPTAHLPLLTPTSDGVLRRRGSRVERPQQSTYLLARADPAHYA